ncbi:hypothetical protein MMC10_000792 [Thelotrema lepadinum]|nr:hypothetical protein [Thelotrema lepadinum]
MSEPSALRPTTIIAATAGVAVASFLAYAAYFDHRRRTDANFRRALKRESKKEARIARSKAEEQTTQQKTAIKEAVAAAKEEGFPDNVEEREAYFMEMVSQGEVLSQQGKASELEAALHFYKALKVYPQPQDLIGIYDKTVPKPVLDVLADMIALDPSIPVKGPSGGGSGSGSGKGSEGGSVHGVDD